MRLSDLKDIRVDRLTQQQLEQTHRFLKTNFNRSIKAFERRGLEPTIAKEAKNKLSHASRLTGIAKLQAEVSIMRNFYYTRKPGDRARTRTMTSTVSGYRAVLQQTGRTLGISNYGSNDWSENQRSDLWDLIDQVRESGADRFLPNGFGNAIYQSGNTFKTISILINDLHITDPVLLLQSLDERLQSIEEGNTMTDREFYGI